MKVTGSYNWHSDIKLWKICNSLRIFTYIYIHYTVCYDNKQHTEKQTTLLKINLTSKNHT